MPFPLDSLPNNRLDAALRMLRKIQSGVEFFAPVGSPEGLAVVDLLRAGAVEFAPGGDARRLAVRAKAPRPTTAA